MFHQIFPSPQVKPWEITSFKHGIYEQPQELPNALRLKNLGNYWILGKCLDLIEWLHGAQSHYQNKKFRGTSNKAFKNRD